MAGRLSEFCCRLRVHGRHANVYVITTLLLIVVGVQRRGGTDDSGLTLGSSDHRRRRHAVGQQVDDAGQLEQRNPVIGVFLLVDLDDVDAREWNETLGGDETISQVSQTHWRRQACGVGQVPPRPCVCAQIC